MRKIILPLSLALAISGCASPVIQGSADLGDEFYDNAYYEDFKKINIKMDGLADFELISIDNAGFDAEKSLKERSALLDRIQKELTSFESKLDPQRVKISKTRSGIARLKEEIAHYRVSALFYGYEKKILAGKKAGTSVGLKSKITNEDF